MRKSVFLLTNILMLALVSQLALAQVSQTLAGGSTITLTDRAGWYAAKDCPEDLSADHDIVESEKIRLSFFGWGTDNDYKFTLHFPQQKKYRRCLLQYIMSGDPRPADWDMLTEIQLYNPSDGLWYELTRAITPYGGSFIKTWHKDYYFDVTEYLPLLQAADSARFQIYYGGFDATDKKAHAVTLRFHLLEGALPDGDVVSTQTVYDSFITGNNGYRAWAYGVEGHSIEEDARMGQRTIDIPAEVTGGWLRVCYTGHGQEALDETGSDYATTMPYFPGRDGYDVINPAEFDYNTYTIYVDGEQVNEVGEIWEENSDNYAQAGTCKYDRAGWGPGKPANVHWWRLSNLPSGGTMNLDFDLEPYVSNRTAPNAAYVANYYVSVVFFGLDESTAGIRTVTSAHEAGVRKHVSDGRIVIERNGIGYSVIGRRL